MVSPKLKEYVRRRFVGMTHEECSRGLYANPKKGLRAFCERGGKEALAELQEKADTSVAAHAARIQEDSLASLKFLQSVRDGEVIGNDDENVLLTRVRAAEFLLGSAGLGPVKRSEVQGTYGVVDGEFLARLKAPNPVLEVRSEDGGSGQSG